ncbi:MAG: hypothetical protein J6X94_01375 [Lachnospiraceae bacterium]|nr:hypothetical protein [Lachnospiraceae bacterium]
MKEPVVENPEPAIIDNDLVKDVVYNHVTFNVGESWESGSDLKPSFIYPGTRVLYDVYGDGVFDTWNEGEQYSYVLDKIRESRVHDKVYVMEEMTPYVTADGRFAYISRLRMKDNGEEFDMITDSDLLIIPGNRYYVMFSVCYRSDETVPLDIREIVDTATFDLGPVIPKDDSILEGYSYINDFDLSVIEFTDSENFVMYLYPNNRDEAYSRGTYRYYFGEEALRKVEELGNDTLENNVARLYGFEHASDYNEYVQHMNGTGFMVFIILETKDIVDLVGNEIQTSDQSFYVGEFLRINQTLYLIDEDGYSSIWCNEQYEEYY